MKESGRTVVVSNRLPWSAETDRAMPSYLRPKYIGLTQTLDSVLRHSGGTWVGGSFAGNAAASVETGEDSRMSQGYSVSPVSLDTEEKTDYQRFSDTVVWPLFHGLVSHGRSAKECWGGYCKVNGRFAETVRQVAGNNDFVWVHDYPLMMVASLLRANGFRRRIGYFHHIPFPHPAILQTLPWNVELLHGLLQFDMVGFQTENDRRNFVASVLEFLPISRPVEIDGKSVLRVLNREVRVGVYPVGIDYQTFSREASAPNILAAARGVKRILRDTRVILAVDRLERTSGIWERLVAFERALERYAELRGQVTMVQIAVPSNEKISDYGQLEVQIETIIDHINGKLGQPDWTPLHYYHRQLTQAQMIAFYRSADVALFTPLRDGMNLSAKEFCACNRDEQGVLILSEYAGAAEELRAGALIVNPCDIDRVAEILLSAVRMSASERQERIAALRSWVRAHDVVNWANAFLTDAAMLNGTLRQGISLEGLRAIPGCAQ